MDGGNPYARMVAVMRGESAEQSAPDANPVKIRLGTVVRREPPEVTVAGIRLPAAALRINSQLRLEAGDTVLLLTDDDQIFYIIMKVVDAV